MDRFSFLDKLNKDENDESKSSYSDDFVNKFQSPKPGDLSDTSMIDGSNSTLGQTYKDFNDWIEKNKDEQYAQDLKNYQENQNQYGKGSLAIEPINPRYEDTGRSKGLFGPTKDAYSALTQGISNVQNRVKEGKSKDILNQFANAIEQRQGKDR